MTSFRLDELLKGRPIAKVPLDEFLSIVFDYNAEMFAGQRYGDKYKSPLFEFGRLAKAHPHLFARSSSEALRQVEAWQGRAGKTWLDFDGINDAEDARAEFIDVWGIVKIVPGQSVIENALALADKRPLRLQNRRTITYARFISYAGWLQHLVGDLPILLPCHLLGKLFGVAHETIARFCKLGVRDGYLVKTKRHTFGSAKKSAAEFRFDTERFPELKRKLEE
jgi:hypothetical protein